MIFDIQSGECSNVGCSRTTAAELTVFVATAGGKMAAAFLHKCFVSGALAKGWGGPVCRAALDFQTHIIESLFWLTICAVSYKSYDMRAKFQALRKGIQLDLAKSKPSSAARTFEVCLAMLHFCMFLQIIYYKVNILSLVNMIQPCHVILLLQGIALYSRGSLGVLISLFILPALTGTLLAMVFPDTGGLDQHLEMESYWVQHYLIQAVPLYLLVRNDFIALKHAGPFTIFCGLWTLLLLHFSLYEVRPSPLRQLQHGSLPL
jgi:hypothetical protein